MLELQHLICVQGIGYVDQKENYSIHLGVLWPQNFYETFKVHLTTMMQYSSTQASKKGGQMLKHWGHLCETYEGAGAANLYFDRKSWMEHFNSHPEIYCTQLFYVATQRNGYKLWGGFICTFSLLSSLSTPPRTPRISGLKSQILKPTFLS